MGNLADVTTSDQRGKINHVTRFSQTSFQEQLLIARWYKPWFYKHVETFLAVGEHEEYIPLREYLLRHDKAS